MNYKPVLHIWAVISLMVFSGAGFAKDSVRMGVPFILSDGENGIQLHSESGRYTVKSMEMIDNFNGEVINSTSSYHYASRRINWDYIFKNNAGNGLKNIIAYSSSESEHGIIAFIDPFQQESFSTLKKLVKKNERDEINYSVILVPTSKLASKNLGSVFCALKKGGQVAMKKYLSGTPIKEECKDLDVFVSGMITGASITGGVIPFVVKSGISYFKENLEEIGL